MASKQKKTLNPSSLLYQSISQFAIPEETHQLKQADFNKHAIQTVKELEQHGYQAFIVGGAVRDLLCGITPKDFDIATNAKPEEVKAIFKNSRLIGRRFRIVHLYFGREILEIATFRASQTDTNINTDASRITETGQLLRDNTFGSVEEDAARRDFSANALYYSPSNKMIYDFVSGYEDIKQKQLKLLGDPEERYKEDPVRMLRAYRFSNKLGFNIEQECEKQIKEHAELLLNVSNARLFDESIKLFHNVHAEELISSLRESKLFSTLYPYFEKHAADTHWVNGFLHLALTNTRDRIVLNKPVTIAYIYAVLLWPEFLKRYPVNQDGKQDFVKLNAKALALMREQSRITSIPKRHAYAIKDIWEFQIRLQERRPKKIMWLLQQRRFRAAYDFLLLREHCGESQLNIGPWWEKIQFATPEEQSSMIKALKPAFSKRKKRKK